MSEKQTRRQFITRTSAAAVGAGILGPASTAWSVQPARVAGTNERLTIGLIGAGGMGRHNTSVFLDKGAVCAAVCDVDSEHMAQASSEVQKKQPRAPEQIKDYRKLLERKDIDAVIIATPDHWHALPFIAACEAGKDAYLEKPICHNITEGRVMVRAARKHQRVVQVGTWQRSTTEFVRAIDYVRAGSLGKVTTVRAWKTDDFKMGNEKPSTPPSSLDYDFWVGPAQMIPYQKNRAHFDWRWYWNYAAGMTGDWGVHMMDIGLLGMSANQDLVMPRECSAVGGKLAWPDDDRTTPDTHTAIYRFPQFVLHWETGRKPLDEYKDNGTEFISADGRSLIVWRGGWMLRDPKGKEMPRPDEGFRGSGLPTHVENFMECVKSRQRPRSDIESMYRTTTCCHLANIAYLAGETVEWDAEKNDIAGSAGKETLPYRRPYRKPWTLPGA